MTATILPFRGATTHNLDTAVVLDAAREAGLTDCIVAGFDTKGEFYAAASNGNGAEALWLVELFKQALFDAANAGDAL